MTVKEDRLEELLFEQTMNAHGWQRMHDALMGWIQSQPEAFRRLFDSDPRPPSPKPTDLSDLRAAERGRAAAIARAHRDAALGQHRDAYGVADVIAREIESK